MPLLTAVAPPPAERPLLHLLAAARTGEAVRGDGIAYESESQGQVRTHDVCSPSVLSTVKPEAANRRVSAQAVYAEAMYGCTALAFREGYADRAQATLDAELPRAVENEFWTGTIAKAASLPNPYLARAGVAVDLNPAGAVPPTLAVALLEQAVANAYSGPAYLHTAVVGFPFLHQHVQVQGRTARTLRGSYVVPGVGYPGTSPTGAAATAGETWMYATGAVTVRVGPTELPDDGALGQAFVAKAVNTIDIRPRAAFTVDYDGPLVAVRVRLVHE